jgi:predicted RNase H-like nuclease (RuvC/YqgF family)
MITSYATYELIRMQENTLKYCKIETSGFQALCNKVKELEDENERLENRNLFLERMKESLKLNLSEVSREHKALADKLNIICSELAYYQQRTADLEETIDDMKTRKYLKDAGKAFARELLGGA